MRVRACVRAFVSGAGGGLGLKRRVLGAEPVPADLIEREKRI